MPATIPVIAFLDLGGPEIMVILLVALLLFGSERLPEFARNLGKSIREFKKATSGLEAELRRAMESTPPAPKPSAPAMPAAGAASTAGFDPDVPDDADSPAGKDTVVEDLKPATPAGEEPDAAQPIAAPPNPANQPSPTEPAATLVREAEASATRDDPRSGSTTETKPPGKSVPQGGS